MDPAGARPLDGFVVAGDGRLAPEGPLVAAAALPRLRDPSEDEELPALLRHPAKGEASARGHYQLELGAHRWRDGEVSRV